MSNFSFLDDEWVDVARFGKLAEDILYQDPTAALTHLRRLAEMISKIILNFEDLSEPDPPTLFNILSLLKEKQILPSDILDMLHFIRMTGNLATHEGRATLGEAVAKLELAYLIAGWAYKAYDNDSYIPKPFEIPQKPINHTNEQVIKEQISDFLRENGIVLEHGDGMANQERVSKNPINNRKTEVVSANIPSNRSQETPVNNRANRRSRQPGDINDNNQTLIEKTSQPSTTHYNQRIWILRCNNSDCNFTYGANGCDFKGRLCPNCQGGSTGEPIEWWGQNNKVEPNTMNMINEGTSKYKLHEAMRMVLLNVEDRTLHVSVLAEEIYSRDLYRKADGHKAEYKQIAARCRKYPQLFKTLPGNFVKLKEQ